MNRHLTSIAALVLALGVQLVTNVTRADVIGDGDACPPGTSPQDTHMGTTCEPAACPSPGECELRDGRRGQCRTMRVCRQSHSVFVPTGQLDGHNESRLLVVEVCAPDAACDGTGDRAPTMGEPDSETIECDEERVCVIEPSPPLRSPRSSGCGCRVATSGGGGGALLLALGVLVLRRRR